MPSKQSSHRHTSLGSEDMEPKLLQLSRESVRTSFPVLRASILATRRVSIRDRGRAGLLERLAKSGDSGWYLDTNTSGDIGLRKPERSGDMVRCLVRSGVRGRARSEGARDSGGVLLRQCDDVILEARICDVTDCGRALPRQAPLWLSTLWEQFAQRFVFTSDI